MLAHAGRLAAILVLSVSVSGCAASMGTVAGDMVGGAAWGAMKGGKLAWKGGSFAAKNGGKVVIGAAKGVHEEFSPKSSPASQPPVQTASPDPASVSGSTDQKAAALSD